MILTGQNQSTWEETCPSTTLSTTVTGQQWTANATVQQMTRVTRLEMVYTKLTYIRPYVKQNLLWVGIAENWNCPTSFSIRLAQYWNIKPIQIVLVQANKHHLHLSHGFTWYRMKKKDSILRDVILGVSQWF